MVFKSDTFVNFYIGLSQNRSTRNTFWIIYNTVLNIAQFQNCKGNKMLIDSYM